MNRTRPRLPRPSASLLSGALILGLMAAVALAPSAQADEPTADVNALCATAVVDIPSGVHYARMLVIGQKGQPGVAIDRRPAPGSAGAAGVTEAVVQVLPGQRLWLAGGSTLLPGGARTYSGSGGNGSFVSTIDPAPYCPGGGSPASAFPKDAFLAVAGGGGGGGDAGYWTSGSTGGSGGAPGSKGGDGGANDARDGAGGNPGTTSGGGAGGAAGYSGFFNEGSAGTPGTYLTGGRAGISDSGGEYAGGGGGGLFGGGGGGGGTSGGSGGGGGGANHLPPYISPNPPTDQQRSGTLRNGSTDQDGPNVQVFPLYPTVTTVTIAPSPAYVSDELIASVRVAGVDDGPVPVGAVELRTGGEVLTGTLSNGAVDIPLGVRPAGELTVQVRYPGADSERVGFLSSSASTSLPVEAAAVVPTTTVIEASPSTPYVGDDVALSATVTRGDGRTVDAGELTFTSAPNDGSEAPTTIARVPVVDGRATAAASFPVTGVVRVTAAYSGVSSRTEDVRSSEGTVSVVVRPAGGPVFTTQPESSALTYGDTPAALSVEIADGPRTSLRWQRSAGAGSPFEDIPGATGSRYQPSARTDTGTRFRVVAVSVSGESSSDTAELTVLPAPLTVTARDVRMAYGTDAPAFEADYGTGDEGFRLGDGPDDLSGDLRCGSRPPADRELPPGAYPVECSGQSSPRYDIGYRAATLTVDAVTQEIRFESDPPTPGRVGEAYDVDASGGASGEPVVFSTDPVSPWCTVSEDGRVEFTATIDLPFAGECVVHADQAGRAFFPPAERESQIISVEKVSPRVEVNWGGTTTVTAGSYRTLNVTASGTPDVRYQWYSSTDNRTFTALPLAQSPTYRLNTRVSNDGVFYRVLVYNASGETPSEGRYVSRSTRLQVDPAYVEVVAPDVEMIAGSEPPVVLPEYSPLIDSDTPASLGLEPTCTVDVTPETPPGVYPGAVKCQGFEHPDYEPYYVGGTLTVLADDGLPFGSGTGAGPASGIPDGSADGSSTGAGGSSATGGGLAATGVDGLPGLALLGALTLTGGLWLRVAGRRRRSPGRSS
ncbi:MULTISPECIES: MBG domain-containing protein [unclassified Rathayibacter]|uniref:MBG domain-containing protein n=1 Tax=unclassified Rathayibacter TaxID=2609250 RepID=UPI0006FBB584|nr:MULTISPECIES: MBG domain-containing protein [unclassified Rathayibacter]KQQ03505.1 hypothetical protein ASF42_08315 [Rathayibacter sp. Leaf294]KQS11961.1 hypothetical protein ASG06_08315 [Rathayibacter sp. Leaf185]